MGYSVVVREQANDEGSSKQTFSSSGFGTPVGAIFIVSGATGEYTGTTTVHAFNSFGVGIGTATDGTGQWCSSSISKDNESVKSVTSTITSQSYVIALSDSTTAPVTAAFDAFVTDGVRVTWSATPGSEMITVILLGSDLVDSIALGVQNMGTGTSALTQTPGFEAGAVIGMTAGTNGPAQRNFHHQLGFASNQTSDGQVSASMRVRNDRATSANSGRINSGTFLAHVDNTGGEDWNVTIGNYTSTQFDLTASASTGSSSVWWAAIKLATGLECEAHLEEFPTGSPAGSDSKTGLNFKPGLVLGIGTSHTSFDTARNNGIGSGWGIWSWTADDQFVNGFADEDAVGTTDAESFADTAAIRIHDDDGTVAYVATFTNFTSDGWTLDFTTSPASGGYQSIYLAFEEATVAGTVTAKQGLVHVTGQDATVLRGRGVTSQQGLVHVTGQDATVLRGRDVTSQQGLVHITGQDATIITGRDVTSQQGLVHITGQDATVLRGRDITSQQGLVHITGQDATVLLGREVTSQQGLVHITGQDATVLRGRTITSQQGLVHVTGQDVSVSGASLSFTSQQGLVHVTGQNVTVLRGRTITSQQGLVYVTGQDATVLRGRDITSQQGLVYVTGQNATVLLGREVTSQQGLVYVTGQDAEVITGRVVVSQQGLVHVIGQDASVTFSIFQPAWARGLNRVITIGSRSGNT